MTARSLLIQLDPTIKERIAPRKHGKRPWPPRVRHDPIGGSGVAAFPNGGSFATGLAGVGIASAVFAASASGTGRLGTVGSATPLELVESAPYPTSGSGTGAAAGVIVGGGAT